MAISIHAPRTGSDCKRDTRRWASSRFQSTLPARGATRAGSPQHRHHTISIHAPRTGSDLNRPNVVFSQRISIHAPRTGSDWHVDMVNILWIKNFNPRSPHGERRRAASQSRQPPAISIHAPRTGSDTAQHPDSPRGGHFNPRSPHGERRAIEAADDLVEWAFQSTLPARGATSCGLSNNIQDAFQSTLPARGVTSDGARRCRRCSGFQSTLPARGATSRSLLRYENNTFQSTLPARGAT